MDKKIISIGYEIPGNSNSFYRYSSNQSLLDADIVVFQPNFSEYRLAGGSSYFQGKKCFSMDDSFSLKEDTLHWKTELTTALENGKTVFVFLSDYEEVYIFTGKKNVSGTGKNARTVNMVAPFHTFEFFPTKLPTIIPKSGKEVQFCGNAVFSTFYSEFKEYLAYEAYLNQKLPNALFLTRTGEKTLGALFKIGKGNLILLPPLPYEESEFVTKGENGNDIWTKHAIQFGARFVKEIVGIDKSLRKESERTPPPKWSDGNAYSLTKELELKSQIGVISDRISQHLSDKMILEAKLDDVINLKDLLFEKGKNLENAVTNALIILGYKAENYDDGNLELDQVIVSPEGDRFIGEVEGKDNSAINIDKFRQLTLNIQEDLTREEIDKPAMGILFGNGFRLTSPEKREEQFTTKCITVAKTSNICLIKTAELFIIAKYIQDFNNKRFAKTCREAIRKSTGKIVSFPTIPIQTSQSD